MEFVPFKPTGQMGVSQLDHIQLGQPVIISQIPQLSQQNQQNQQTQSAPPEQSMPPLDKKEIEKHRIKNKFIEKYNLRELKSNDPAKTYYYDSKSKTVFELGDSRPIVFMKPSKEVEQKILSLNGMAFI